MNWLDKLKPTKVDKKLYTMPTLKRVGKKDWKCTLCSKDILKGVEHHYWRSPADGYTENRVHLKCFEKIMERGVHEYRTRTKKTPPLPDNAGDKPPQVGLD